MNEPLLAWQWKLYSGNHVDRRNLLLHLVTVPFFWSGSATLLASPWLGWPAALAGLLTMVGVVALQGRTHRLEAVAPVPFSGPVSVLARIFAEQFITFPRYVLSGGLSRAWKLSAS